MIQDLISFLNYMDSYGTYLGSDIDFVTLSIVYITVYAVITIGAFLLKGFGLYNLSINNGVDKPYLSFIPFVSFYQLGRLIGPMSVFRVRVKNFGLVVGILTFVVTVIYNVTAFFRYFDSLQTILNANAIFPVLDASGTVKTNEYIVNEVFYYVCRFVDIINLIFTIFLYITFFRLFASQNYFLYSVLSIIIDPLFAVFVFVVRKNKKGSFYRKIYIDPQSFGDFGARARDFSAKRNDDPFSEYNNVKKDNVGSVFDEYPDNLNDNTESGKTHLNDDDGDDLF